MTKIILDPSLGGSKTRYKMRNINLARMMENGIARIGWLIVIVAALSLSFYSLYFVGRHYGLNAGLAALVSLTFDGAAIACANLALRYARSSDSALMPTIFVFILAGASSYLNAQHAVLIKAPQAAVILYACPPIISVLLFELYSRYERRNALRKAGRIAKALPPISKYALLLYPIRSIKVIRNIVGHRLDQMEASEKGQEITTNVLVTADPRMVRAWAIQQGFNIGDRGRISGEIVQAWSAKQQELLAIDSKESSNDGVNESNESLIQPNLNVIQMNDQDHQPNTGEKGA